MERGVTGTADQTTEHADTTNVDGRPTTFNRHGAIPPVTLGYPDQQSASASDLAFGNSALPLAAPGDLKARADRMEVERLLESGGVTSGQDAIAALDFLLGMSDGERKKIVDRIDDRAFANLLDRLTDDQRVRFTPIVEAAQDPKRRLKLWAAQHTSRARDDLERYRGNFGDGDGTETDQQIAGKERYDRRKSGVDSTEAEVTNETGALMKKRDLSVADVDAMRARKDKELDVEIKHNINLVAETTPRADGSSVQWSKDETAQLDQSLDKLPAEQADGANSVAKYTRRANRNIMDTKGGQYKGNEIDIDDNAHIQPPGRDHVAPVEYAVTHEVGHDVAHDNPAAFAKFEKAAGWHQTDRAALEKQTTPETLEHVSGGVHVGDELVRRDDEGHYNAVDDTAIPSAKETGNDRWNYAAASGQEHFAEVYAMAVETPELLYADYVEHPATRVRELEALVHEQQSDPGKLADTKRQLEHARKAAAQRKQLYDIIRNDVFEMQKHEREAVQRIKQRGANDDQIKTFEQRSERVSTPAQLAGLERELFP
ncbi:MAG TPA: hypothetical protein VF403_05680 [Kofleriaceae bacterium]